MTLKNKKRNKLSIFSKIALSKAGIILGIGLLLAGVGFYYSIQLYKNLRTDIEELLPSDARSGKDLAVLTSRLESIDYLAVLVFSKDTVGSKRFIDDLAQRLETLPKDLVASVEFKIDKETEYFQKRLPLFLEISDLEKIRSYVKERIRYEKEFYNPLNIFPVADKVKKPELNFEQMQKKYRSGGAFDQYPGGYYATPDAQKRVMLVYMAGKHSNIHKAIELQAAVRKSVSEMNPTSYAADLEVKYTGGVENFIEEHSALMEDLELSTVIVILLVTLSLVIFYRDWLGTTALLVSLFMGTFWTFGVAFYLVGYLNANSAFLGSIVIGNGINFGIIFLARYLEERRNRKGLARAIDLAIRNTATSTWTAALAAGLAYGSLILTRFRGFQQFGVIGLEGMVLCWISSFTLLPALLILLDRWFKPKYEKKLTGDGWSAQLAANVVSKYPKVVVGVSVLFTLVSLATLPKFSPKIIETNLNNLRNKFSIEQGSGFLDRYLIEIFQHYLTPTLVMADSREQAMEVAKRLRERKVSDPDSSIEVVQVFDDFIPKQQQEKFVILRDIKSQLTPRIVNSLDEKEKSWVKNFLSEEALRPVTEHDLPPLIRRKFTEKDGQIARFVVIEPPMAKNDDIAWDGRRLVHFISAIREEADKVKPGLPVSGQLSISADMVDSISMDGPRATLFAFLAVMVLVVILFREVRTVSMVLSALLLGVLWLFGLILGCWYKINFLNFIALPITFGIGVDYGVNMFQRYRQEGASEILNVIKKAGGPVMLASLTTIIGYFSLLIASNQAFVSFGRLAIFGEFTTVFAAVFTMPALLLLLSRRQVSGRKRSFTVARTPTTDSLKAE